MNPQPNESATLASLIGRLAAELNEASTGELAELRRLVPDDPGGAAFWRIVVTRLEPDHLPGAGFQREQALRRWAVILRAMATLQGLHEPRHRLGAALAEAGVSEVRLNRLLRAGGETLFDQLRGVVHQLAATGIIVDLIGIARLVLSNGRADEQAVRQTIANDYYARIFRTEKENV